MALSCNLTNSILKTSACGYSMQKVVDLFLVNRNDVTAIERVKPEGAKTDGAEEVSAITLTAEAKWAHIQPSTNSASFTDALTVLDNGGAYRTHTVSFSINGAYSPDMVAVVNALSLGEYCAVAQLASGEYILLGSHAVGLAATAVTNTGAASAGEASGIAVEMSADVTVAAAPLAEAAIKALTENVAEAL